MTAMPETLPPRARLLAAADELFYAEGVHSVGIDRIIEKAGVAKASLYKSFGSKEELVHAYLTDRHEVIMARHRRFIDAADTPRDKLLAVFDSQASRFGAADFRGCAFAAAMAEAPAGGLIEQAALAYRTELRGIFAELAAEYGAADPHALADQLMIVYDGTAQAANLDHNTNIGPAARAMAEALLPSPASS